MVALWTQDNTFLAKTWTFVASLGISVPFVFLWGFIVGQMFASGLIEEAYPRLLSRIGWVLFAALLHEIMIMPSVWLASKLTNAPLLRILIATHLLGSIGILYLGANFLFPDWF